MTQLESLGQRDPERQGLYDEIVRLSNEGKLDIEISAKLKVSEKSICHIMKVVLQIINYGRKRVCDGCGQLRSITLFNLKSSGLCVYCRCKPKEKAFVKRNRRKDFFCYEDTLCMRCDKCFRAKVFSADGKHKEHICPTCREVIKIMETGSL